MVSYQIILSVFRNVFIIIHSRSAPKRHPPGCYLVSTAFSPHRIRYHPTAVDFIETILSLKHQKGKTKQKQARASTNRSSAKYVPDRADLSLRV